MKLPDNIASEESLGRGVFSSRDSKRASRRRVPYRVFLERDGVIKISVDRLDFEPPNKMAVVADKVAAARRRTFYGWAVLAAKQACEEERRLIADPQLDNPYHANIVLPDFAGEDREEQVRHAQQLADNSRWRERPTPSWA